MWKINYCYFYSGFKIVPLKAWTCSLWILNQLRVSTALALLFEASVDFSGRKRLFCILSTTPTITTTKTKLINFTYYVWNEVWQTACSTYVFDNNQQIQLYFVITCSQSWSLFESENHDEQWFFISWFSWSLDFPHG